jgi:hypothetical protein
MDSPQRIGNDSPDLEKVADSRGPQAGESHPPVTIDQLLVVAKTALTPDPPDGAKEEFNTLIGRALRESLAGQAQAEDYNILIHFDEGELIPADADKIYSGVKSFTDQKPLLLVLYSTGGNVNPAYLIGKLCRKYSNKKFIVVIPRLAKSAATLICCAADEIHMGDLSELGPIDPQIGDFPALGLKNAVEHLAGLTKEHPYASAMLADYLNRSLGNPLHLGYCERVAESAVQYAVRLLEPHTSTLGRAPEAIANKLVYDYKDHGFAIDADEAKLIFGEEVIKVGTAIYQIGSNLYERLRIVSLICDHHNHNFYHIGTLDAKPVITRKRR